MRSVIRQVEPPAITAQSLHARDDYITDRVDDWIHSPWVYIRWLVLLEAAYRVAPHRPE